MVGTGRIVSVTKMQGTGNDFLMVDNREKKYTTEDLKAIAAKACPRRISAGADGVIFVEPATNSVHDYMMRIINADGSEAEMCGNGSRCIAAFAHMIGAAGKQQTIQTLAGTLHATVAQDNSSAKVQLSFPSKLDSKTINIFGEETKVYFIDTGVPHAIVFVDDVKKISDIKTRGGFIRFHEVFAPKGTNVNFVQLLPDNSIHRGVEDETFACGTGSTAAALVSGLVHNYKSPVKVTTSGGALLTIYFDIDAEKRILSAPFLEGAVETVYKGEFYWN